MLGPREVYTAAILRPHVIALLIQGGGVVNAEEHLEDLTQLYFTRIEGDTYHLDMTALTSAHLLVRWRDDMAITVARLNSFNPFDPQENSFGAPKAPASKHDGVEVAGMRIRSLVVG